MKTEDVSLLYDRAYAREYDNRFLLGEYNQATTEFEVDLIAGLLGEGARWLDIGCGTGYFLGRFPGIARAGLDLSPAMLSEARARNPDAMFLRHGDFRDPVLEWTASWSLISCMWAPYSYADTIGDIARMVQNMIDWTAPGGTILIPTIDLPYLGADIPYRHEVEYYRGPVWVNGYIWSWYDERGAKRHEHMILPHAGQFVEWLEHHFEQIKVVRSPTGRRVVLAQGRRSGGGRAEIAWDPDPGAEARSRSLGEAPLASILSEVARRLHPLRLRARLRPAPKQSLSNARSASER